MTSELIQYDQIFTGLTPSEEQTAKEEWHLIGDAIERKDKAINDNLRIAQSLTRIREKHGRSSKLYRSFLDWLGEKDSAWQDKHARLRMLNAYKGAQVVKACGSEAEQAVSISKFDSMKSLAAAKDTPNKFQLPLAQALQRRKEKVTTADMKHFNKTGRFPKQNGVAPARLESSSSPQLTDDDKVLLLNLYIDDYIRKHPVPC